MESLLQSDEALVWITFKSYIAKSPCFSDFVTASHFIEAGYVCVMVGVLVGSLTFLHDLYTKKLHLGLSSCIYLHVLIFRREVFAREVEVVDEIV